MRLNDNDDSFGSICSAVIGWFFSSLRLCFIIMRKETTLFKIVRFVLYKISFALNFK